MKIAILISRILLGLGFTIFGLNILFPFLPMPPPPPGSLALQFMMIAGPSHWMTVVGIFELLGGIFVLLGGTAPVGLLLLAPVLVNILCFHICLMGGEGIAPGFVFSLLELFLLYSYRSYFQSILTTKAKPQL
ncbi:MAG: DoxX family membrane protein [Bdellovibrionota bacterium]